MPLNPSSSHGGGGAAAQWTTVTKPADQSIASSTVLTTDTALVFTGVNGGVYEFEVLIVYASPAGGGTPDMNCSVNEDGTTRGAVTSVNLNTGDGSNTTTTAVSTAGVIVSGTATTNRLCKLFGVYYASGAQFRLQWCQNTSGANPTIVRAGSLLRYNRIA